MSGARQPLGPIALVRAALATAGGQWPLLLALWGLGALWTGFSRYEGQANSLNVFGAPAVGYVPYLLVSSLGAAVLSAVALRLLLNGRAGLLRVDGRLFAYLLVATLVIATPPGIGFALTNALGVVGATSAQFVSLTLARAGVGYIAAALEVAFLLWPIGLLMGGPAARPLTALAAMRGAVLAFVAAVVIVVGPTYVVGTLAALRQFQPGAGVAFVLAASLASLQRLALAALAVEIYRARFVAPRQVAEVFA